MQSLSDRPAVAIYARVSTEEQREGQTIDSQVTELERFAGDKSWHVAHVYKEEGWSGSLLARPELDRLRDDASTGKFSHVLINDVDRLARDVSHLGIVKRDLARVGVEIIFRKLPAEKSPTYNLMVNILGSFAEFEREMITDRTRRGRRHKVETRQQFLGAKPAYGYRYIPGDKASGKTGSLEINPEEALIVRQMYEWVDREGLSIHKVLDRLNANSVLPRSGRAWAKSTITRILRSEIYAGVWHYNKHYSCEPEQPLKISKYRRPKSSNRLRSRSEWLPVILPTHLRIIQRDQWERVQKQLTNNIALSPRSSKHLYLLKGLVRCAGCGATYVGDPCHGKFYYRCRERCKKMPMVIEARLEATVWGALEEAVLKPAMILDQLTEFRKRKEKRTTSAASELTTLQKAREQALEEESRILEAYRNSIIDQQQLAQELSKLQIRKNSLEAHQERLQSGKTTSDLDLRRSITDYCRQAAREFKLFTRERRQRFLRLLITSIIFDGEQVTIRGVIPIEFLPGEKLEATRIGQASTKPPLRTTVSSEKRGGLATTASGYKGHNPDRIATIMSYSHGRNSDSTPQFEFTLIKPLVEKTVSVQPRDALGKFASRDRQTGKLAA